MEQIMLDLKLKHLKRYEELWDFYRNKQFAMEASGSFYSAKEVQSVWKKWKRCDTKVERLVTEICDSGHGDKMFPIYQEVLARQEAYLY